MLSHIGNTDNQTLAQTVVQLLERFRSADVIEIVEGERNQILFEVIQFVLNRCQICLAEGVDRQIVLD